MARSFEVIYLYHDEQYMYFEDQTQTTIEYNDQVYKKFESIGQNTSDCSSVEYFSPLKFRTKIIRIKLPQKNITPQNLVQTKKYIMHCKFGIRTFNVSDKKIYGWLIMAPSVTSD